MRHRSRAAFTILEVVLVIALLAILVALVFPTLDSMYGHHKVTAGTDAVRSAWVTAQARAIDQGVPYRFSYIPEHGNYRIAPDAEAYWGGGNPPMADPNNPPYIEEDVLPKGVRFIPANSPLDNLDPHSNTALPKGSVNPQQWMTLAVFLPDGTARDDARITLFMTGVPPYSVHLRAMTGVITITRGHEEE